MFGDTSENVDEVTCPRFLFVCIEMTMITKTIDYEKTVSIIRDDVAAIGGECP